MANLEQLNWKIKERMLVEKARMKNADCELEGATLMRDENAQATHARVRRNPYANTSASREYSWQNEPDPTMPSLNPFAQARNLNGRRQSEVADDLGTDVVEIIRLEQGLLGDIPEATVKYYRETLKLPEGWQAGYRMFQGMIRRSAPRPIHGIWRFPPGQINFQRWRVYNWPTLSQMGFCKAFCIHPSSLYVAEKTTTRKGVPYSILVALIEANVMSEDQAKHFAYRIRQSSQGDH